MVFTEKTFTVSDDTDADDQVAMAAAVSTAPCFLIAVVGVSPELFQLWTAIKVRSVYILFLHSVMNVNQTQNITQLVTLKCKSIIQV